MTITIRVTDIRTDGGTQSRAGLDMDQVMKYAEQMEDGANFPPVIVFYDGTTHWLADGFHRLEARRQGGMTHITADIRQGDRLDALRYSLGANDKHGLPRNAQDYRRAYQCAVDNSLCKPDDTASVQKLLNCTTRHAQRLTREARDQAKAERDRKITELAAEGKTQREIAAEVGSSQKTVDRALESKRTLSEMTQPTPQTEPDPQPTPETEPEPEVMPKQKPRLKVTDEHLYKDGNPFSAKALYYVIRDQMKRIGYSDPNAPEVLRKIIHEAQQILSTIEKGEAA